MTDALKNFKESLVTKTVEIINIMIKSEATPEQIFGTNAPAKFFSKSGRGLIGDDVARYETLIERAIESVQRAGWWKHKLSQEYIKAQIENAIEDSILDIRKRDTNIIPTHLTESDVEIVRGHIDDILVDFKDEYPKKWKVYVPLIGIIIENIEHNTLKIGKAQLIEMNDRQILDLYSKIDSSLVLAPQSLKDTPETKEQKKEFIQKWLETIKDTICAVYDITAEPGKALEIAEEYTQHILYVLTYTIAFLHSKSSNVAVGLQGEMGRGTRTAILVSSGEDAFHIRGKRVGALPFMINPEVLEIMEKLAVFDILSMLEKSKLTGFDDTFINGITWFVTAQKQLKRELEFVSLVTCLETFLSPGGDERIAASIGDGCAVLIEDELEKRKRMKKAVKEIYGLRSEIVHTGSMKSSQNSESCLEYLRELIRALIWVMIKRKSEFKDKDELLMWIDEQRLKS